MRDYTRFIYGLLTGIILTALLCGCLSALMGCSPKQITSVNPCPSDSIYVHDTVIVSYSTIHDTLTGKDTVRETKTQWHTVYKQVSRIDTVLKPVAVHDTTIQRVKTGNVWPGVIVLVVILTALTVAVIFFKRV